MTLHKVVRGIKEEAVIESSVDSLPLDSSSLSLQKHSPDHHYLPASSIIDPDHLDLGKPFAKNKLLFTYHAVLKTIETCLGGKYSEFDGHTTANCCHGMALLSHHLINEVLQLDLTQLKIEGEQKIALLEKNTDLSPQPCTWWLPKSLINLTCLYILFVIKESDPLKGGRTVTTKLKTIAPISTNTCNEIAHDLKKRFSNWIAMRYSHYLNGLPVGMQINDAPVEMWGKYVSDPYLRKDKRGLTYASNLFSMQIFFAYLIYTKSKVALINDIIDSSGKTTGRYVSVFQGDGESTMKILSPEEIKIASLLNQQEPVVVLGGCVYSDEWDKDTLAIQMQPWENKLTHLLLACDAFYPQFFQVVDDPAFVSDPIVPSESILQEIISHHSTIKGVSATDPSLYCATHIYTASLNQVLQALLGDNGLILPFSFIPKAKH